MSSVQFWSNESNRSKETIINVRNAYDELIGLRKKLHAHRMRVGELINQLNDGIVINQSEKDVEKRNGNLKKLMGIYLQFYNELRWYEKTKASIMNLYQNYCSFTSEEKKQYWRLACDEQTDDVDVTKLFESMQNLLICKDGNRIANLDISFFMAFHIEKGRELMAELLRLLEQSKIPFLVDSYPLLGSMGMGVKPKASASIADISAKIEYQIGENGWCTSVGDMFHMSAFNESGHPRDGCLYVEKQDDKVKYRIQLAGEVTEGVLDIRIYTEGSTISDIANYAHAILNKTAILGHNPQFNLHYFWEQLEKKLQLGCSDSIEYLALYCTSKNNLDFGYRLDEHNQLKLYLMEDWIKFLHELGHAVARLKGEAFTESQNLPTELRHYNNVEEYLNICVRQWNEHVMEHPDIRRVGHKIRGLGEIKSLSFKTIYDKFIAVAQFDDSQEQVPMELKYREFMMQRERSQSDVSNEERKSYFRPI